MASGREVSLSLRLWFLAKIQAGGTLDAGNIIIRQFKMKNTLFFCALACKCVR